MAKDNRAEYTLTINGIEHTVLLSPEDVERYGEAAKKVTARTAAKAAASDKAVTPENK